jgi:hypothetical protein
LEIGCKALGFEQALIKVEKEKEFEELKGAITRAFAPENAGKYLKRVASAGLRIRDFDLVLVKGVLEQVDGTLAGSGQSAQGLYAVLALSDQAQMKEFYLSKVEEVDRVLRARFHKLYQYY